MQRGADLVADVGEKAAFRLGGGVGGLHGLLEFGVQPLEVFGLGAFFQFGGEARGAFLDLAAQLEVPENDQEQHGKDDFDAEQARPEGPGRQVQRRRRRPASGC